MKIKIIHILIIYILFSCSGKKPSTIYHMSFTTETIRPISCENLKKSMLYEKHLSYREADKLYYLMSNLQSAEDEYYVDARAYGMIYDRDGNSKSFCMGNNIIEIDNKKYFISEELRNFIMRLTRGKRIFLPQKDGVDAPPIILQK